MAEEQKLACFTQAAWIAGNAEAVKSELMTALKHPPQPVDILIVVHNGLEYLKECIESIRKHTEHYTIWLYDNGSARPTFEWMVEQSNEPDVELRISNWNSGFIEPNNELVCCGSSPFVILLNTDTVVQSPYWTRAITSMLLERPEVGVVGYRGGILDEDCKGTGCGFGEQIDYIEGWCMGFARTTYQKHGLFDAANLKFAYGEDADFCLRLRQAGLLSYALHLDCVLHHGNKTVKEVAKTRSAFMEGCFLANHAYLKSRWSHYLSEGRAALQPPRSPRSMGCVHGNGHQARTGDTTNGKGTRAKPEQQRE